MSHILPAHVISSPCSNYATTPQAGLQRELPDDLRGDAAAPGLPAVEVSNVRTSGPRAWASNTLVLGLVALAFVGVALIISYRAQNGLPWISTYDIHADVPDGSKLLKNADVRIGGARVGQVLRITAMPGDNTHPPFARLDLALNSNVGPLPADSTVEVRLASVLGGKFLDLIPGRRGAGVKTIPAGGVLELKQAKPAIDTDVALRVFNPEVRQAIRDTLGELGRAASPAAACSSTRRSARRHACSPRPSACCGSWPPRAPISRASCAAPPARRRRWHRSPTSSRS